MCVREANDAAEREFFSVSDPDADVFKGVNNSWVAQLNTSALERTSIEDQQASGLTWFYNYFTAQRARFAPGTGPGTGFITAMTGANLDGTWANITDAEYCPMVLAPAHNNATELAWLETECPEAMHLLGPTEPDQETPDQLYTGWPVADLLDMWGDVYEPWRAAVPGRQIGMPAVAQTHPVTTPGEWTDLFMQGVASNGYHVDFIPIHFFYNYSGAGLATGTTIAAGVPVLRNYLRDIWNLYHLPMWPEIGVLQTLGNTEAQVVSANALSVAVFRALNRELGAGAIPRWSFWPLGPWGASAAGKGLYATDGTITAVGTGMKSLR